MNTFQQATFEEYSKYLVSLLDENTKIKEVYRALDLDESLISKFKSDNSLSEKEFVELIALFRRRNYSQLAGGANKAAEQETDRLYAKNPWKFIEEFLQNADDCEYKELPKVDIIIDEKCKAIEFIYNEKGFNRNDIWAITAFSQSTKQDESSDLLNNVYEEGVFYKEKTGRKGKGFKAVFSLNAENIIVHIRSNGFSFKLDNKIGRIMPVWEEDPTRMDGRTHVLVEFVNPIFDFCDAFHELKTMFCVENIEKIFEKSPFIFMHRIKDVHVLNIGSKKEEFETCFEINHLQDRFNNKIVVNPKKTILAGIKHQDVFYERAFQQGRIIASFDSTQNVIPVIKYTQMVEDQNCYRNYSIIAPVLRTKNNIEWKNGALFRTFPMSLHSFEMPFAIDAPFELNPDRSGIQYRDEKMETINASDWNNIVSKKLFGKSGVFEEFMLWLRTIEEIRIDKYIRKEKIELFTAAENKNNDSYWVSPIDLSEITHRLNLFKLFMNNKDFVSYDNAQTVNQRLFSWPHIDILFKNILGDDFKSKMLSELYIGSDLFNAKPIVKIGFVDAFNEYIDYIEKSFEEKQEFYKFISTEVFSFFKENGKIIKDSEERAFANLKIYFSTIKEGKNNRVIREALTDNTVWISSKNRNLLSINKYRILETSPVKLSSLIELSDGLFHPINISSYFAEQNLKNTISKYENWSDIKQCLEATLYYGFTLNKLNIQNKLSHFALSTTYDKTFNPFRDSNILTIIDDSDVEELAEYFGSTENVVNELKRLGLKRGDDFFEPAGNCLDFREDTLKLLEVGENLQPVLISINEVLNKTSKKISTSYDSIKHIKVEALNFLLNEDKKLLIAENITNICDIAQEDSYYWNNSEIDDNKELLLRVCSGAAKTISNKELREIIIPLEVVLKRGLEKCVINVVKRIGKLEITNNGFFEKIDDYEIKPFIHVIAPEKEDSNINYYKGNLKQFGGKYTFLNDGRAGNIYLNIENGDYKAALTKSLNEGIDTDLLNTLDEMERKYRKVNSEIIQPMFKTTNGDLKRTYELIEKEFEDRTKEEIISILSWFRYSGYTNALGNGNIQNEKEIEDDYKNSPWKFIYEFIQNVDDCEYSNEKPILNITLNKEKGTIQFDYNENGFSLEDIKSLTKFGDSSKISNIEKLRKNDGIFDLEKTGRKGRGFKSVFSLPGSSIVVHISSNGYNFKFEKRLGSIIPIWEDIENAPEAGTRIIVEGFDKKYANQLSNNIEEMFGVRSLENFTASCPVLYLRKLDSVSVTNGEDTFCINFERTDIKYSNTEYKNNANSINAGIIHNGTFKNSATEFLNVSIINNEKSCCFKALRYSELINVSGCTKLASVFAPIITETEELKFKKGALYRVLPLDENKFDIPLAIDLPFETNSGRSSVTENITNKLLCETFFRPLVKHFYEELRLIDCISIEQYIPKNESLLLHNLDYCIDLQQFIREIELLRSYDDIKFVSCNNAKTLTKSCYEWENPQFLADCFSSDEKILVQQRYAAKNLASENIILCNNRDFVNKLNLYLDALEISNDTLINFFQKYLYKYLKSSFDTLKHNYIDNSDELSKMKIFVFEMNNGTYVREAAEEKNIWIKNVPAKYSGYGKYRNIEKSSLQSYGYTEDWIKHEIIEFDNAFTATNLSSSKIKDWDEAAELLKTILYYDIQKELNIPYLKDCVLEEEFDSRSNVFRDAYKETPQTSILNHIISKEDLIDIAKVKGLDFSSESISKLAKIILAFGLREEYEVFETLRPGIYILNSNILDVLSYYCTDYKKSEKVIKTISTSFNALKNKNSSSTLQLSYDEISNCDDSVFAQLFAQEFLSKDILKDIATEYCKQLSDRNTLDSVEAFFRGTLLTELNVDDLNFTVSINDICERSIGSYIRDGFLKNKNYEHISLSFVDTTKLNPYDSEIINKALKIIDKDSDSEIDYEYYVADLESAFIGQRGPKFLVDNTKVILNQSTKDEELLAFIKKRFTNDESGIHLLFNLFGKQQLLQSDWTKSKKEYIKELADYRKIEKEQINFLCPNFIDFINQATENPYIYVIPELLQNINDCKALKGQEKRILEVSTDISNGTMILTYDEAGFDFSNVYSITAIGQSTKHDESEGEKGLGFKKVFTLFERVEIYSNGFSFFLTKENNTIPCWIENKNDLAKYSIPGKTTMKFTVRPGNNDNLLKISESWEKLVNGDFLGSEYSPLFLRNIDEIRIKGIEKPYIRNEVENDYVFRRFNILSEYKALSATSKEEFDFVQISEILKSRRKCKTMSQSELENYVNTLSFEIAVPRKNSDMQNKGAIYSTLPTEEKLYANIFINIPLELTTARDGIDKTSEYNIKVLNLIFHPIYDVGYSLFSKILEIMAFENKELFVPIWFGTDFEKFKNTIQRLTDENNESLLEHLANSKILRVNNSSELINIRAAYTISDLILNYINTVKETINDLDEWMQTNSSILQTAQYYLILPERKKEWESLISLAKGLNMESTLRFPLEQDSFIDIKFLRDEYNKEGEEKDG